MDSKTKLTVEIYGELYALKGARPEHVIRLAQLVDRRMKLIANANSQLSPLKVAVLAALHITDEYVKLEQDYDELIAMLKEK